MYSLIRVERLQRIFRDSSPVAVPPGTKPSHLRQCSYGWLQYGASECKAASGGICLKDDGDTTLKKNFTVRYLLIGLSIASVGALLAVAPNAAVSVSGWTRIG